MISKLQDQKNLKKYAKQPKKNTKKQKSKNLQNKENTVQHQKQRDTKLLLRMRNRI